MAFFTTHLTLLQKALLCSFIAFALTGCGENADCAALNVSSTTEVTLTGKFEIGTYQLPNGEYKPYILKLSHPVCIISKDPELVQSETPITEIQMAGQFQKDDIYNAFGKDVQVTGTLYSSYTIWHVLPYLIDATKIEKIKHHSTH